MIYLRNQVRSTTRPGYWALAAVFVPRVARAQSGNSGVCSGCHRDVWETYRRTGMGRSFYRPSPENIVEDFSRNTYYHQPLDSYFMLLRRGGEYYQRRHQIDSRGNQVNVMEKRTIS